MLQNVCTCLKDKFKEKNGKNWRFIRMKIMNCGQLRHTHSTHTQTQEAHQHTQHSHLTTNQNSQINKHKNVFSSSFFNKFYFRMRKCERWQNHNVLSVDESIHIAPFPMAVELDTVPKFLSVKIIADEAGCQMKVLI